MNEALIRSAVYALSQIVCAQAEAMGMAADNHNAFTLGKAPPYLLDDFKKLIDRYGISHNAILTTMQE